MKNIFSLVAGILFVTGFIPYVKAILRKNEPVKPSKATWLIWAILDTITIAGMYVKNTVNGQIIGAFIGAWVIVALAIIYGKPGWTKLDKFCLLGAIIGIAFWQLLNNPELGIVTSLGIILIGSIPTFASAWKDPSREDKLAWTIFWVSCIYALLAVPKWTIADAAQPLTFFAVESIMMYILFIHKPISKKEI